MGTQTVDLVRVLPCPMMSVEIHTKGRSTPEVVSFGTGLMDYKSVSGGFFDPPTPTLTHYKRNSDSSPVVCHSRNRVSVMGTWSGVG